MYFYILAVFFRLLRLLFPVIHLFFLLSSQSVSHYRKTHFFLLIVLIIHFLHLSHETYTYRHYFGLVICIFLLLALPSTPNAFISVHLLKKTRCETLIISILIYEAIFDVVFEFEMKEQRRKQHVFSSGLFLFSFSMLFKPIEIGKNNYLFVFLSLSI